MRRDALRDVKKQHLGSSGKCWVILHFLLLWLSLSSADSMGRAVLHIQICIQSMDVYVHRQGSHLWLWPGSSRRVTELTTSVLCMGVLNLWSPSKQRIQCVRFKDTNHCEAGRSSSNMIISRFWRTWLSLSHWKLPYNLIMFLPLLQTTWNK